MKGLFLSHVTNKLDRKGRVSVPSAFRALLADQSFHGIIAGVSLVHSCIEASGMARIEQLHRSIEALDPYDAARDAFATILLGQSEQLPFDGEGRIILPEHLLSAAKLSDAATFVGKGLTFEIWEPEAFRRYAKEARQLAYESRAYLTQRADLSGGNA